MWVHDPSEINKTIDEYCGIGSRVPTHWALIEGPFATTSSKTQDQTTTPSVPLKCKATISHFRGPTIIERDTPNELYAALANWAKDNWADASSEAQDIIDRSINTNQEIVDAYFQCDFSRT